MGGNDVLFNILDRLEKLISIVYKSKQNKEDTKLILNTIIRSSSQQIEYIQHLEKHIEKIHNELSKCTK